MASELAPLFQSLDVRSPGVAWALGTRLLFFPDWLEGEWALSDAKLEGVQTPLGRKFVNRNTPGVTKASALCGFPDVGAEARGPLEFHWRFVRSESLGGVVADRAFNTRSTVDGFLGFSSVQRVEYDPSREPTRMSVVWSTPRRDTRWGDQGEESPHGLDRAPASFPPAHSEISRDLRKAELFINNRRGECGVGPSGRREFRSLESFRQVTQAGGGGYVYDYATLTSFEELEAQRLAVRQRLAAFVVPQESFYFEVLDRATAIFDYSFVATRVA